MQKVVSKLFISPKMNSIKKIRHKYKLTQRKLAELLEVEIRTVQRWEYGEREPHLMTLKLIQKLDDELSEQRKLAPRMDV